MFKDLTYGPYCIAELFTQKRSAQLFFFPIWTVIKNHLFTVFLFFVSFKKKNDEHKADVENKKREETQASGRLARRYELAIEIMDVGLFPTISETQVLFIFLVFIENPRHPSV